MWWAGPINKMPNVLPCWPQSLCVWMQPCPLSLLLHLSMHKQPCSRAYLSLSICFDQMSSSSCGRQYQTYSHIHTTFTETQLLPGLSSCIQLCLMGSSLHTVLLDSHREQERREERQRMRTEAGGVLDPLDDEGSFDDGDPYTTNLYIGRDHIYPSWALSALKLCMCQLHHQ